MSELLLAKLLPGPPHFLDFAGKVFFGVKLGCWQAGGEGISHLIVTKEHWSVLKPSSLEVC